MVDQKITQLNLELTTPAGVDWLAVVDDPTGSPVTKKMSLATLLKFTEFGSKMVWDSATGYHVEPGRRLVNGTVLEWAADITRSGLSSVANTLYYVYLFDNLGTPAAEESTTGPTWNSTYRYWQKTGDATRRMIGAYYATATDTINRWTSTLNGSTLEVIYKTYTSPVSSQASTASWTSFSLASNVPVGATHWSAFLVVTSASGAGDDGVMAVSPFDQGTDIGTAAMFSIRDVFPDSNKSLYPGRMWVPIETAQTAYYRTQNIAGSVTGWARIQGYRFEI